jgi:hypothetical protein
MTQQYSVQRKNPKERLWREVCFINNLMWLVVWKLRSPGVKVVTEKPCNFDLFLFSVTFQ